MRWREVRGRLLQSWEVVARRTLTNGSLFLLLGSLGAWPPWLWVAAAPPIGLVQLVFLLSYKKTQETLSQAGQKTSAALSTVGSAISRKLGDMR